MEVNAVHKSINLYNEVNFKVNLVLEKQSCNMSFVWNDKMKRYCATLIKSNGDILFEGVAINPHSIFPVNSSLKQKGLNGYFTLHSFDINLVDTEDTIKNWKDYYFLFYSVVY